MINLLERLWTEEEGQDLTEYALLYHLAFRGAVNTRIGPAFFPAVQISLRFF